MLPRAARAPTGIDAPLRHDACAMQARIVLRRLAGYDLGGYGPGLAFAGEVARGHGQGHGVRQVQAAQPAQLGRPRAGAAPVLLLRHGTVAGRHRPAVRGRGHHLERGRALQHRARAPGAGGQARRRQGGRHAARVHDDHRHRRYRHGPPGHEVVPGQPRGDRGFGRAHRARPRLRCAGGPGRLRQVAAGPDDGDGAAQCAVGVHVRRLYPARQMAGSRRDRAGRVRGCGQARGRRSERR